MSEGGGWPGRRAGRRKALAAGCARVRPAAALALGGLVLALAVAAVPLARLAHQSLNATGASVVTGLLVGVYAGLVLLATRVMSLHSTVAVAVATLAAAALFNPLRRRVQKIVDRRFNRARYDADRIIAAFAARLRDGVDLDAVQADLASSVQQTLEPAHISVWIQAGGRQ